MKPVPIQIKEALKSEQPKQALNDLINTWREKNEVGDVVIVSELASIYGNSGDLSSKQIVLDILKLISPHIKCTLGEPSQDIQLSIINALRSDKPSEKLRTLVSELQENEGLDDAGIYYELSLLDRSQFTEEQEDAWVDVMDLLYGW